MTVLFHDNRQTTVFQTMDWLCKKQMTILSGHCNSFSNAYPVIVIYVVEKLKSYFVTLLLFFLKGVAHPELTLN